MPSVGTHTTNGVRHIHPPSQSLSAGYTEDLGMKKRAVGAMVFNASTAEVTLTGQLGAFAVGDQVQFTGTVSNNGFFSVTGINAGNYLVLDPAPKNETAPATAVIRTV